MDNTVIERIRLILKTENYTQQKFSDSSNLSLNTIKSVLIRGSNPSSDFLIKVLDVFPQYSANWILTGTGDMLIPPSYGNMGEVVREMKKLQTVEKDRELDIMAMAKISGKYYAACTLYELKQFVDDLNQYLK